MVQKRLFRKVVRTAGAGIQFRQFRVANRSRQAKKECDYDAYPHGRRCIARGPLNGKREPKERAWRNQRHRIHRKACQA